MTERKPRFRLFPKRGYILLLIGILIGFLLFTVISMLFARGGVEVIEFLYTSEKQGSIGLNHKNFASKYTSDRI